MWVGLATKVKTLRLPEDVCQTVESFPGENFTEKFVAAARLLGRCLLYTSDAADE